jgi:predicted 3-demethylubiquinone-9 3-methyltransferase (glyoxalase superfamily)
VKQATFTIAGQNFMATDGPVKHDFTFTPAMSLFVDCMDKAEIDAAESAPRGPRLRNRPAPGLADSTA